jgi:hypothetical protein
LLKTAEKKRECAGKVLAYSNLLDTFASHFMRTTTPTIIEKPGELPGYRDVLLITTRIDRLYLQQGEEIPLDNRIQQHVVMADVPKAKAVEYLVRENWFNETGESI